MDIKKKLPLVFLAITTISLILVVSFITYEAQKQVTKEILSKLDATASIQKERINENTARNLERLSSVSSRTQLRLNLDRYVKESRPEDQQAMNKILQDAKSAISVFRVINIMDLDGTVVASTNEVNLGKNYANEEFFIKGQKENDVRILFKDQAQNLLRYLTGPLVLEGRTIGVVTIEIVPSALLATTSDYSGLGSTGETVIAKKDEQGNALFIAPTRHDPNAALNRRVSKEQTQVATIAAITGKEGTFTDAVDYRGVPVLSATRYLESLDRGIVVKIDKSEAFAPIKRLRNLGIAIGIGSLIFIGLIILMTARSISGPIAGLTNVADQISRGRTDVEIDPILKTRDDEIGRLAQSFDRTIVSLKLAMKRIGSTPKDEKEEKK